MRSFTLPVLLGLGLLLLVSASAGSAPKQQTTTAEPAADAPLQPVDVSAESVHAHGGLLGMGNHGGEILPRLPANLLFLLPEAVRGPLMGAWLLMIAVLLLVAPGATLFKLGLFVEVFKFRIASKDTKGLSSVKKHAPVKEQRRTEPMPPSLAEPIVIEGMEVRKKTIVFVRHGESMWNETFNRGFNPIFFGYRVLYACLFELHLFVGGRKLDSWLYDSPLNLEGLEQAQELREHLRSKTEAEGSREEELRKVLTQPSGAGGKSSVLVASNLRRAISTGLVGFADRIELSGEKMLVLPQVQEISKNPDANSITPGKVQPVASWKDQEWCADTKKADLAGMYTNNLDVKANAGNKKLFSTGT